MDKAIQVIDRPRYMQSFACIGSACEENCCQGWQVHIDRVTFRRYQEIRLDSLRSRLQPHLKKLPDGKRTDAQWGLLEQREDGRCPVLNRETGLCDVQSTLGASYLSHTCATYPRARRQRGRREEEFATLSCPAAARLALTTPDALDKVPSEFEPVDGDAPWLDPDPVKAFAEAIYETACALLRSEQMTASEALIALGVIVRKPRSMQGSVPAEQQHLELVSLLAHMVQPETLVETRDNVALLPSSPAIQQSLLTAMHDGYMGSMAPRPRFREILDECIAGLGLAQEDRDGLLGRYEAARTTWFEPFDRAHPWLLRNYLLNDLGRTGFPAKGSAGIEIEYMHLAVRFALIKLYLVGLAAHRREAFGIDDYVRVIQSFSRNVEHNNVFVPHILERLGEAGLNSVASAALLLR